MSRAFFFVQPLRDVSLSRTKDAILTAASTAAISEGPGRGPPHLGLAVLSQKPKGGDARLQLLVRPSKLNLRELHAALAKLPVAGDPTAAGPRAPGDAAAPGAEDTGAGGGDEGPAGIGAAPASKPILGLALKSVIEHLCTYPDHASRGGHVFAVAHEFTPDPLVTRVLQACGRLGVSVHFFELAEPSGAGGAEAPDGAAHVAPPPPPPQQQQRQQHQDARAATDQDANSDSAATSGAAAGGVGGFAEALATVPGASYMRLTADCEEADALLRGTWLRHLLAPPPLDLTLKLPQQLCGSDMASLRTVPRLLQLRPLLQPGMLCPCHGQPLRPPPPPAPGGWPELGRWRCASGGGGAPLEEAAGACTPDASLLQFGAHTLLRMPVPAMAAAARGFCRPLGLGEAVIVASEAVVPSEALDAQLLLGPALLVVPSAPPALPAGNTAAEQDRGGDDGDGGGVRGSGQAAGADANARRVRALCSSLRARGAVLLCSCEADLDARRSLPVKQWCALQAGGEGAALLLWRLASAEQLLPPSDDDASAAGATPNQSTMVAARAEDEAEADAHAEAAAEAEAAAALSLLDAARVGVPGLTRAASSAALMPALPSGIAAWSQAILQASMASYTPPPSAPAAQAAPGAADGGRPAAEGGGGGGISAGEQEEGDGGKGPGAASGSARPAGAGAHRLQAQEEGAVRGQAGQFGDAGGGGGDGAGQQHARHTEGAAGGGQRRLRLASSSSRAGSGSKGGKGGKGGLSLSRIGA